MLLSIGHNEFAEDTMVVDIGEGRRAKKPPLVFTCVKKSPLNEEYGAVANGLFAYAPVLLSLCKLSCKKHGLPERQLSDCVLCL